jgi:hypothetical protein
MDGSRFDALTRSLAEVSARRLVVSRLAAGLLSLAALHRADVTDATQRKRKNRKKRKKPLPFNEFGCLNVGARCRGKAELCCSGICRGKKPKQGKRDKRRCVAHDTGGCTATASQCGMAPTCTTTIGRPGGCLITTGDAPYCADTIFCSPCSKDAECVPFCGPLAACVICPGSCPETGGRHCTGPGDCAVP